MSNAIELADRVSSETDWYEFHAEPWCIQAAAELRRLADIEHKHRALLVNEQNMREERNSIVQAISDPENQPSQYGTVTLDCHERKVTELSEKYSNAVDALLAAREELAAIKASLSEPVAVIGSDFALYWAGSGPIAPIVEKHGLKVGSPLYALKEAT